MGNGRRRLVAHHARRQLRALGGDEAPPRQRAGPLHRHRLCRVAAAPLDRIAAALLEKETLGRDEVIDMFADVVPESSASDTVGTPRVVAAEGTGARPDFGV
jgi:hypothetical protein